jgi:uncharacterized RDD family membrane protein YckC
MNTHMLQRLTFLAVLPLCTAIVLAATQATASAQATAAAQTAETRATADPPSSAAPAAEDSDEPSDWNDRFERRHQVRHHHHDNGNDLVNIGHDSNLPRGLKADSVVSVFGSSTSDGEAGDVVSVLGDTRVTGEVSDSAVAVLGNVYIDGKVDGDAVAVLGSLKLGPHAEVGGSAVAVAGNLERDPAAIVHGSVQNVFAGNFGNAGWLRTWIHQCLFYGRPLALEPGLGWAWGLALTCLAFYATLALLFRDGLTRCVRTFETEPGHTVLAALIAMLLTPVLLVLLCVTVIGIAAVPFVVVGLFCAGLFGKAVMLMWLGRRITGSRSTGPASHPVVLVLIGGAVVLVLYVVPVLGFLVYKLLGLLGLGAVVYTLILAARAHRAAHEDPAAPTAGAPPPGTPASPGITPAGSAAAAPPVTAALPRAGFWIRMGALLIDALLVGFVMGVLHVYHLELLVLAAYGAVMWKLRGSTIGGIVFDLRVVRFDDRALDWETAIVRALGCFLSLAVAGLGFIWIAFDANNQAWHDKIAGTLVVRVAKGVPLV